MKGQALNNRTQNSYADIDQFEVLFIKPIKNVIIYLNNYIINKSYNIYLIKVY